MGRDVRVPFTYITVPILNDDFSVIVSWGDEAEAYPYLKKFTGTDEFIHILEKSEAVFWTSEKHTCLPVMYIKVSPDDIIFMSLVAHEAVHCIDCILDAIGEGKTKELVAHSVGAIVRAVSKRLQENN